jgi:hypothetical protein
MRELLFLIVDFHSFLFYLVCFGWIIQCSMFIFSVLYSVLILELYPRYFDPHINPNWTGWGQSWPRRLWPQIAGKLIVPDSKSRNIPEVVLAPDSWGFGDLEGVGQLGEGWGKWGQFTSNLRPRWTIPVTAGGCQVSERGHKGETKGSQQGEGKSKGNWAMYICNHIVCAMEWLNIDWH